MGWVGILAGWESWGPQDKVMQLPLNASPELGVSGTVVRVLRLHRKPSSLLSHGNSD